MPRHKPIEYEVDENGCHICTSHPSGNIRFNGKIMMVHRVVYITHAGEIPDGMLVIRTCRNTKCINPAHLKLESTKEFVKEYRMDDIKKITEMIKPRPIDVKQEGDCLICTSHKRKITLAEGGRYELNRHIYSEMFELPDGVFPSETSVYSQCGNKHCINPEHLKLMSLSEHNLRPIEYEVDENGCHNCTSHKTTTFGYPMTGNRDGSKEKRMHRYVYEKNFGPIPPGLVVRHKCDNPRCINPDHLELGTRKDNVHDMFERGRAKITRGEANGRAKLTEEIVRKIKLDLRKGLSYNKIAAKYNINRITPHYINTGKTWKHVTID